VHNPDKREISIIVIANIIIFALALVLPRIAFWMAIILVSLRVFMFLFEFSVGAWFVSHITKWGEPNEKKGSVEIVVTAALLILLLLVYSPYLKWRKMALTLCVPSLISASVAVYSVFIGLGQNLTLFMHIIAGYSFLRLLVHFTLNLISEGTVRKRFPIALKIFLEGSRFITIVFIVANQDMNFMYAGMPTLILSSVVATIAIDTIIATLEKYPRKLKICPAEVSTPTDEVVVIENDVFTEQKCDDG